MVMLFKWNDISIPIKQTYSLTTRRIAEHLQADIYIARDALGDYSLIILHKEDLRKLFFRHRVDIGSISSDYIESASKEIYTLQFRLKNKDLLVYFDHFIQFVLQDLSAEDKEVVVVEAFLLKLKNWKKFISCSKNGKLSPEQIRGLLAELNFLNEMLISISDSAKEILDSWYGPERIQHDFIFKNLAVEIKSISSVDKQRVKISSIHQLETNLDSLYLKVIAILEAPEHTPNKITLNEMVAKIKQKFIELKDEDLITIFESKLLESNYIFDTLYDKESYIIRHLNDYEVIEGFPRLASQQLPIGILNLSYEIDLNAIQNYQDDSLMTKIGEAL